MSRDANSLPSSIQHRYAVSSRDKADSLKYIILSLRKPHLPAAKPQPQEHAERADGAQHDQPTARRAAASTGVLAHTVLVFVNYAKDFETLAPALRSAGLTVGVLAASSSRSDRSGAFRSDNDVVIATDGTLCVHS